MSDQKMTIEEYDVKIRELSDQLVDDLLKKLNDLTDKCTSNDEYNYTMDAWNSTMLTMLVGVLQSSCEHSFKKGIAQCVEVLQKQEYKGI